MSGGGFVLGVDLAEAERVVAARRDEAGRRGGRKDTRVCVCGHPGWAHSRLDDGSDWCKPSRAECPCEGLEPVLEVRDTRHFKWRTSGGGAEHALLLGVAAARMKGVEVEWTVRACWACRREGVPLAPYAVGTDGKISSEPEIRNGMLCAGCAEALG